MLRYTSGMPRIAVCGGAYANPHALRAWVADARARGAERLLCLGDLGGFGAECDAVWPVLTDNAVECIAGNYDIAIGRGDADCGCGYTDERDNHFAQLMYDHTLASTSREFAAWMAALPHEWRETVDGVDVHAVHGSPLAVNDFLWGSLDDDELRPRLAASGAGVLLCTHTGIPWQRRIDGRLVVNVGTVGRPANDGRVQTWYALLDVADGEASAELIALDYDWRAQAASMRAAGLPEAFVETVETGWWTTCLEVVPAPERARGRYHVYREALPSGFEGAGGPRFADAPEPEDDGSAGGLPVRHRGLPVATLGLLELPLQPRVRLLRRRLLSACAATRAVARARVRAGRRGGGRGLHRALRDRRRAVRTSEESRSYIRRSFPCSSTRATGSTPSC